MARQRSSLEVRAGTCAARGLLYQNCQYPYMQLSVQSRAKLKPDSGFRWVRERCNMMGSAEVKKLIDAYSGPKR